MKVKVHKMERSEKVKVESWKDVWLAIRGERDLERECRKEDVLCEFRFGKKWDIGQKMREGVWVMCWEMWSTWVIIIQKSEDKKGFWVVERWEWERIC